MDDIALTSEDTSSDDEYLFWKIHGLQVPYLQAVCRQVTIVIHFLKFNARSYQSWIFVHTKSVRRYVLRNAELMRHSATGVTPVGRGGDKIFRRASDCDRTHIRVLLGKRVSGSVAEL